MIVSPPSLLIRGRRSRKLNLSRSLSDKWIIIQLSRIYWKWKTVTTDTRWGRLKGNNTSMGAHRTGNLSLAVNTSNTLRWLRHGLMLWTGGDWWCGAVVTAAECYQGLKQRRMRRVKPPFLHSTLLVSRPSSVVVSIRKN